MIYMLISRVFSALDSSFLGATRAGMFSHLSFHVLVNILTLILTELLYVLSIWRRPVEPPFIRF